MIVKTYSKTNDFSNGLIVNQLHDQIELDNSVENFDGIVVESDNVRVVGDSLLDEISLDAVISNHIPDMTTIYIKTTVRENKDFSDDMLQRLKQKNLSEGLSTIDAAAWVHHRLRKVPYTLSDETTVVQIDVLNLVVSGDIETAESVLGQMTPDDMTETYHWWTQSRIDWIRNEIRTYLGWPLL